MDKKTYDKALEVVEALSGLVSKAINEVELIKLSEEVEYLRKENSKLNDSVGHYQKMIESNAIGIRCKELEKVIKELEKVIQEQQKELEFKNKMLVAFLS